MSESPPLFESKDNRNWLARLKSSHELLGLVVGVLTSLAFLWAKAGPEWLVGKASTEGTNRVLLIGVDLLNLVILILALCKLRPTKLSIKDNEVKKLASHLTIKEESEIRSLSNRASMLVEQLVICVRCFAVILAFFYFFQLIADWTAPGNFSTGIEPILNHSKNIFEIITNSNPDNLSAAKYLAVEILTNSTNLFSAAFLFLAFQVLFLVTLEDDHETWKLKSFVPISLAVFITLLNIYFFVNGFNQSSLTSVSHVMRLVGGVYNGFAMFLLFSRFVSMEYFFQNARSPWQSNF